MTTKASALLIPLLSVVAAGCATFPPPEERKPEAEPALLEEDPVETTAEWLFVTSEGQRAKGKQAQCAKVAKWLEGEKQCTGEICVHARDLGREWLAKCEEHAGSSRSDMQNMVGSFEERADLPADACVREGRMLLQTQECGAPEACEDQAQKWIARCGSGYATPLFILMLTRTLQRHFPDDPNKPLHKVEFDPRSCDVLAEVVGKGVGCDGPEPCRLAVEAGEAWMDRCYEEDTKVPTLLAFRMADVRVGGGHGVDPIPINPLQTKLDDGAFPLLLDDNKGIVTWVCGMRPKDLDAYLDTRRGCKPGEIIIARIDAKRQVRTVSVPHPDDEEFRRLFPFLTVKGEKDARALAGIDAFRTAIAEAVDQAGGRNPEEAIATLARALRARQWPISRRKEFQKILTDADAALVPAFEQWGERKVKSSHRIRDRHERAMFAGRALQNPLHDMGRDGSVDAGSYAAPWPMTLHEWMPSSFAAYRDAIKQLERTATRLRPSDQHIVALRMQARSEIRACAAAEKRIQSVIDEVMDCMFEEGGCTQAKIQEVAEKADPDRRRAARARRNILRVLAAGYIGRAGVERLEAERISSGCLDP